jgi:hypothetical protein
MVAAAGIADNKFRRVRSSRIVAVMRRFAHAAGMRRRSGGRQGQWGNVTREREEQQQSGGQTMHIRRRIRSPSEASIEQELEKRKPVAGRNYRIST